MRRIDLRELLQRAVADGYGDLVTRRTGQAVRAALEQALAAPGGDAVAVIDFGTVRCLDLSCADEIVGRLLRQQGRARCLILANVSEAHREAIEFVLEGHGLSAVMLEPGGTLAVLGPLPEPARRAFAVLVERGTAGPDEVARRLEMSVQGARAALEELRQRGLVLAHAGAYSAPLVA